MESMCEASTVRQLRWRLCNSGNSDTLMAKNRAEVSPTAKEIGTSAAPLASMSIMTICPGWAKM